MAVVSSCQCLREEMVIHLNIAAGKDRQYHQEPLELQVEEEVTLFRRMVEGVYEER